MTTSDHTSRFTEQGASAMNNLTTTSVPSTKSPSVLRRRAALALAIGLAAGAAALPFGQNAAAASPGVFNTAQCNPNNQTIAQDVEAYRGSANEYVVLQGALVKVGTTTTYYSQWLVGYGPTAHNAISWSNVPRGQYSVFYRWGVWNPARAQYTYSGWVQLNSSALVTFGQESYPGSGVFIGGSTGRCLI
jgi:hypothetical protein